MTIANRITIFRLSVIPVFLICIYLYGPERGVLRWVALGIYLLAAVSDFLDGYLARRLDQRSVIGARLDPLADKLLMNLGFIFTAANPHFSPGLPLWFPVLVLTRDSTIVLGSAWLQQRHGALEVRPRWSGKLTTAVQMLLLLLVLGGVPWAGYLVVVTTLLIFFSCADYVYAGIEEHNRQDRA